jgi:1,4-alpha-glucan branching enzyme
MSRALELIVAAMQQEPLLVLGPRVVHGTLYVRAYLPRAVGVDLVDRRGRRLPMQPFAASGLFEWRGSGRLIDRHPLLAWRDTAGQCHLQRDPYSFDVGALRDRITAGAHGARCAGFAGTCFAVRAADAAAAHVLGEFNDWCRDSHPLARTAVPGVWALFVPGAAPERRYRFEIHPHGGFDGNQTADERHAQIAAAAYRRAQQRRFEPGHELEDWLEAEREVDAAAAHVRRS